MHMLYNSDSFSIVQFEIPLRLPDGEQHAGDAAPARGGFEIVDKFARKEIYIEGELAATFMAGVEALMEASPSEEEIDEYIGRFSPLMHRSLTLH